MRNYIKSLFSVQKIMRKNISLFCIWSNCSFGENSEIRRFSKLKNCEIGRYSRINPGCKLSNVTVKNFTAIGRNSSIGLGQHPMNYISTQNIFYKKNNMNNSWVQPINLPSKEIIIGNDVWIGVESVILDGVSIGDGAVIGARSVVTKNVPPYAIVVGQPAKIIKYRFSDEIIQKLLCLKWWDFSEDEISRNIDLFREPNITVEFLDRFLKE